MNNEIKKKIGFVPQEYAFYEELSPVQNLEYFGVCYFVNGRLLVELINALHKLLVEASLLIPQLFDKS